MRKAALLPQPAAAVRRGDRPTLRTAPGQLPAGLPAFGADQCAAAPDPGRRAAESGRCVRAGSCRQGRSGHQPGRALGGLTARPGVNAPFDTVPSAEEAAVLLAAVAVLTFRVPNPRQGTFFS